jgi:hypothetical protein
MYVGCFVIVPIDGQMLQLAAGREKRAGNEMRLRVVLLSQLAIRIGAASIEISE